MTLPVLTRLAPGMAKLVLALAMLPVLSSASSAAVYRPIDSTYKLVFQDRFDGSALDTSKWTPNWLGCPTCITHPVQRSNELAAYDPAQVKVANGYLHLNIIEKPVSIDGKTYPFRSGMVQSHDKAHFTYGYFEARIHLPLYGGNNKIANWPIFWTDGEDWPEDGEIDIVEALGDGEACWHYHSPSGGPGGCEPGEQYTGWHIYGALWEPGKVTYYYDGVKVGTITQDIQSAPHYIILNYGLSYEHGGEQRVPATMRVGYVKVWQKK